MIRVKVLAFFLALSSLCSYANGPLQDFSCEEKAAFLLSTRIQSYLRTRIASLRNFWSESIDPREIFNRHRVYRRVEFGDYHRKRVVIKNLGSSLVEAAIHRHLSEEGLLIAPYVGIMKDSLGTYMVTEEVEAGAILKHWGDLSFEETAAALRYNYALEYNPQVALDIRNTVWELTRRGYIVDDLQFLLTYDGRAVLIDIEFFDQLLSPDDAQSLGNFASAEYLIQVYEAAKKPK